MARIDTLKNFVTDIADKFREKLGIEGVINHSDYDTKIDDVYDKGVSDGKKSQYDEFWDKYQDNGERTDYDQAFSGKGWTDDIYNPQYPITVTSTGAMYQYCQVTKTKQPIIVRTSETNSTMFYLANSITEITELKLETDMPTGSSTFRGCNKLERINITGTGKFLGSVDFKNAHQLKKESIYSIVYALSPNVTGQTVTFSKQAVNREFGINVDDESTWGEGTVYRQLVDTKPNWTITHG